MASSVKATYIMTTVRNTLGFGTLALSCISSTESENGGFVNKLQYSGTISKDTPFGKKTQKVQHTFYMKTDEQVEVGAKHEMNLDEMRITEREFEITEQDSELFGQTIMLKWLHF